ncbi:hypothetical protein PsYK624_108480 [Phanerochaete sordida]|uniref:Uncharacterized protein n=1 Tax=Phanerochaete sordida TaxID=48140 RepID=A0A9P3LI04_9APHY|nr:hypothetical protein PsYK624_108480 [Phanerochaete sordida]
MRFSTIFASILALAVTGAVAQGSAKLSVGSSEDGLFPAKRCSDDGLFPAKRCADDGLFPAKRGLAEDDGGLFPARSE